MPVGYSKQDISVERVEKIATKPKEKLFHFIFFNKKKHLDAIVLYLI